MLVDGDFIAVPSEIMLWFAHLSNGDSPSLLCTYLLRVHPAPVNLLSLMSYLRVTFKITKRTGFSSHEFNLNYVT